MINDLHTHTSFSDGQLAPQEVVSIANAKGYGVGISDHCGVGSFQINQDDQFNRYLRAIEGLPVFKSAELDLGTEIGISRQLLDRCDYLIGGVHSLGGLNFFDAQAALPEAEVIVGQMLDLIEQKAGQYRFHILAHPGLLPIGYRKDSERILDKKWSQRLVELALKYGFALEISSRWELPSIGIIKEALDAGIMFSLGSDGHCQKTVCCLEHSMAMIKELGIPEERIFQGQRSTGG